jgi:hypothetical protein
VDAAAVQARQIGYDPDYVWVAHPIQDRKDEELNDLADKHIDEILEALTKQ